MKSGNKIILMLLSACIFKQSFTSSPSTDGFLKFMTQEEALTYHGEKIVYFGVGTGTIIDTDRDSNLHWGRWQYLPTCISNYIKKNPALCTCISFDGFEWKKADSLKAIEDCIKSRGITEEVKNNNNVIRIVKKDLGKKSEIPKIESYLRKILATGGIVILANFAPLAYSLEIDLLYNQLAKEYPHSICLMIFNNLWIEGSQFIINEYVVMSVYVQTALNSGIIINLLNSWKKSPGESSTVIFDWNSIIKPQLDSRGNPPFYRTLKYGWKYPNDYFLQTTALALGYNHNEPYPSKNKFIEDIVLGEFSGKFIPSDFNFVINTRTNKFTFDFTNVPHVSLESISGFASFFGYEKFPDNFVQAVANERKRYKNKILESKLNELSSTLNNLSQQIV